MTWENLQLPVPVPPKDLPPKTISLNVFITHPVEPRQQTLSPMVNLIQFDGPATPWDAVYIFYDKVPACDVQVCHSNPDLNIFNGSSEKIIVFKSLLHMCNCHTCSSTKSIKYCGLINHNIPSLVETTPAIL